MPKRRFEDVDEEAASAEQVRYLRLNTSLPLYAIAKLTGCSPQRVQAICNDDVVFMTTFAIREETEIENSRLVRRELLIKLRSIRGLGELDSPDRPTDEGSDQAPVSPGYSEYRYPPGWRGAASSSKDVSSLPRILDNIE